MVYVPRYKGSKGFSDTKVVNENLLLIIVGGKGRVFTRLNLLCNIPVFPDPIV